MVADFERYWNAYRTKSGCIASVAEIFILKLVIKFVPALSGNGFTNGLSGVAMAASANGALHTSLGQRPR